MNAIFSALGTSVGSTFAVGLPYFSIFIIVSLIYYRAKQVQSELTMSIANIVRYFLIGSFALGFAWEFVRLLIATFFLTERTPSFMMLLYEIFSPAQELARKLFNLRQDSFSLIFLRLIIVIAPFVIWCAIYFFIHRNNTNTLGLEKTLSNSDAVNKEVANDVEAERKNTPNQQKENAMNNDLKRKPKEPKTRLTKEEKRKLRETQGQKPHQRTKS